MEPVTLLLVLVVAWMLFGASGGAGASSTAPADAGAVMPQHNTNQSIPDGTGLGACPPGTNWTGRGCTEPSFHTTDMTAQPMGGDAGEAGIGQPPTVAAGTGISPPPRTVGRYELRTLDSFKHALAAVPRGPSTTRATVDTLHGGGGGAKGIG